MAFSFCWERWSKFFRSSNSVRWTQPAAHRYNCRRKYSRMLAVGKKDSSWRRVGLAVAAVAVVVGGVTLAKNETTIRNWSGTHEVETEEYHQVNDEKEVEDLIAAYHSHNMALLGHPSMSDGNGGSRKKKRIRPLGSALSPNGVGLSEDGMINLSLLDKVISVDTDKMTVTVQAGIRISSLVDQLLPYGLTLRNFASISEQQIGGLVQVGAHGTGATIPPMEEHVLSFKIVTPAKGTITVSRDKDPELFKTMLVGLGCFGVVTEVTLQCIKLHNLEEKTWVSTRHEVRQNHVKWLQENRHLRYMWIPHTSAVVVVTCNPHNDSEIGQSSVESLYPEHQKLEIPKLVLQTFATDTPFSIDSLSFTQIRDELIALNPSSPQYISMVNQTEEIYWQMNSGGRRVDRNDKVLSFDCGGSQWVAEVAFPCGTLEKPDMRDLDFIDRVLMEIEKNGVPAPAPIEQRWTAASSAMMSPAYSSNPKDLFSWVGIIMYLPPNDKDIRQLVTSEFEKYKAICRSNVWDLFGAREHWAKIEVPLLDQEKAVVRARVHRLFDLEGFERLRKEFDPTDVLGNKFTDAFFKREAD